jgi:hypothetical protein
MQSSRVGIGVVGYGYWGPNLVRNFVSNPSARLVSISDLDPEKRAASERLYPGVATTGCYEDLLKEETGRISVAINGRLTRGLDSTTLKRVLQTLFTQERAPRTLGDLLKLLKEIPEYRSSSRRNAPPKVVSGSESNKCGRIFVDMTGGTEGSKDIFERYAAAGVSTLVGMHFSEEALDKAKKASLNVVIAGHVSSDTLGLNLLFDEIEKEEPLEFVGVSGFERIRRTSG